MTTNLTPMERALLDTLDRMATAEQKRDETLNAKIDALSKQIKQQEELVMQLQSLLSPLLPTVFSPG